MIKAMRKKIITKTTTKKMNDKLLYNPLFYFMFSKKLKYI